MSQVSLLAVIFGGVDGLPAQYGARVLEIAVAPLVAGGAEEDIEADRLRGVDAALEKARDVALAAPDGKLARRPRPVLRVHAPEAHADDRQPVGVRVVAPKRFSPDLAGAVEARGPERREVRQDGPRGEPFVTARDEIAVGLVGFDAADGGAARGEDYALDAGLARGLEDIVGPGDVVTQHGLPRGISHLGRQVHDGLDAGDVGLVARHALDGTPIQRAQVIAPVDLFPERTADEAAQPRDEDAGLRH